MEYHSNRFKDNSLLFYQGNDLVAVLPANLEDSTLCSHGGLTFGGVISGLNMSQTLMLEVFHQLMGYCKEQNIKQVIYKPVPHIYHTYPAEEDLYALSRNNAQLISRNVASAIFLQKKKPMKQLRKRTIKKAQKQNVVVKQCNDFKTFMEISADVLKDRHESKPVHATHEIEYLAEKFPDNLKLFAAYKNEEMLAGVVVYEYKHVAHAQYAANSDFGWDCGAEDAIFDFLINQYYRDCLYFDFGISNEKVGQVLLDKVLNEGLIRYKEGFGASSVVYDCYRMQVEET